MRGGVETRALRCEAGTVHLPQLFSANMAVCRAPAPQMHETSPRFKGSPAPFFHLFAPAHGQNHRLIFQNMFLARAPLTQPLPPLLFSLYLPFLPCPHDSLLSIISLSLSLSHSPFPVHHLFSPFHPAPPKPNLHARLPKCMIFLPPYLFFSAPVLLSIQSLVQYVLWINKK